MHLFMPYNIVSYSQFDWGGFPLISNNQLHNIWQQSKVLSTNLPIGVGSVSCAMWQEQHVIAQFIVFSTLFFYIHAVDCPHMLLANENIGLISYQFLQYIFLFLFLPVFLCKRD